MLYIQAPGGISPHVTAVGANSVKNSTFKHVFNGHLLLLE